MRSKDEIFAEYLEMKDVPKAIAFLISGAGDLIKAGQIEEGEELLNLGHRIVDMSNVKPEDNPYVKFGTKNQLFCWDCNKFVIGKGGKVAVTRCKHCQKSFCPKHAKKSFMFGAKCPFCQKRI